MRNKNVSLMTKAAIIAALYVIFTMIANALGLANHAIQLRFSEALCILPLFSFSAVPGLYIGCLVANLLTGAGIWDVVFGSVATLIGACGTYLLRKKRWLAMLFPVLANIIAVPLIMKYGYGISWYYGGRDYSLIYFAVTVGIGELLSVYGLGSVLYKTLLPYRGIMF